MRALHVISSLDLQDGGPTAALIGLASAQKHTGLEVGILATWKRAGNEAVVAELQQKGIDICLVGPTHGPIMWHPHLHRATQDCVARSDIVHIHALWEQVQHEAAKAARRRGITYLIRPCGMLDPWSLRQSRWKKKIYMALRLRSHLRHADALHFTSERECELVAPLQLGPPGVVEPNGVDLNEFDPLPPPGTFRAQYPALGDKPIVLFLSRLHYKKGLHLLIPAFAKIKQGDAMLVIAGPDSGGYRAVVEKLIERHGLQNRAILTGMIQGVNKIAALADATVFCLPSYQENFGISVVEAMAAGTPPIISDGINIHGEITAARAGDVVSIEGNPEVCIDRLATAMDLWLADPDLCRQTGQRARAHVFQRFGWGPLAQRWKEHYEQLVSAHH